LGFQDPSDVFSISLYEGANGLLQGAQLTHENITAGVAAIHALLPASHTFSALDTIASAHSLSTAYGRAVAYTAVYEGVSFATLRSSNVYSRPEQEDAVSLDVKDLTDCKRYPIPFPTILFMKPEHLRESTKEILKHAAKASLLYQFGWRHKAAGVTDGFLTRESLWDRMVFDNARAKVLGNISATTRAVFVSGGMSFSAHRPRIDFLTLLVTGPFEADLMTPARIAYSVPVINVLSHPLVTGPVLASHAFDLQDFPSQKSQSGTSLPAHTGPPGVNVEVKLVGVDDDAVESGSDPVGVLFVRGPPVAKVLNVEGLEGSYVDVSKSASNDEDDGWTGLGIRAKMQTNGAMVEMVD
jgi:long-chain acyl-CoA synthetase